MSAKTLFRFRKKKDCAKRKMRIRKGNGRVESVNILSFRKRTGAKKTIGGDVEWRKYGRAYW